MLGQEKTVFHLDLSKKLNVAHINICTEAEGPYRRMAIWFQGCNIMCEGCCNPELQEIKMAYIMTVKNLVEIAVRSKEENKIEGVTFLGGEPTLQEGISHLANALRLEDIGTILFTGRKVETLGLEIVKAVDLIIDGKFERSQIDDERNLVGSKNQRIVYVTDRYIHNKDWFMTLRAKRIEINLNNSLFVNGDIV